MEKFKFKKRYGQNFLQDGDIIKEIVSSIQPKENDLIIEIGPGSGAITKELIKYNSNYLAFEIDEDTKKFLIPLQNDKTKIIYKDILEADISSEILSVDYNDLYIIGNLPYYITTPILEKIIESNLKEKSITIMVQKEVAERYSSKPKSKDYGYITVLLNYYYTIEKIVDVSRNKFYPVPNVDSTVIKLNRKEYMDDIDIDKFKILLKSAFQFKRKTLKNNLKGWNLEVIESILSKHGLSLSNRAEELSLDVFIDIFKGITREI